MHKRRRRRPSRRTRVLLPETFATAAARCRARRAETWRRAFAWAVVCDLNAAICDTNRKDRAVPNSRYQDPLAERYTPGTPTMKSSTFPATITPWRPLIASLLLSCILALFESPSLSIGQTLTLAQFNHTSWTSKDGAPADAWAMAQTPDGWLWFGAADGLYRFDGVQFEHVELQGLGPKDSRSISTLYASESGALWIGRLNSGVTLLKDGRFVHFGETVGFGGSTIAIAEDSGGGTWVSCAVALLLYDGATWSRIGKDWGFPDQYAISVFKDRQGRLWIEGQHGIFTVDLKSRRLTPRDIRVQGIGEFIESPDGRTWFADEAGVQGLAGQPPGELNPAVSNARASYGTIIDRIGSIWRSGEAKVERRPLNLSSSEPRFRGDPDQFSTRGGLSGG